VFDTAGTYFIVADVSPLGFSDGTDYCLGLPELQGVAAIPLAGFSDYKDTWKPLVRFAFCKRHDVLREASERLAQTPLFRLESLNYERVGPPQLLRQYCWAHAVSFF